MARRQGLPVKWIVLSVAVFLGSTMVFVAIPQPALHWARTVVVQPLAVFTDGTRPAVGSTSDSAGPTHDAVNPVDTRRRETN